MTVRKRRDRSREFLMLTERVFEHSVDATLGLLAYVTSLSLPIIVDTPTFQARIDSEAFLQTVNYETIKNALITARRKRYIIRRRHAMPEITREGLQRLRDTIPQYNEIRAWDGRLHIVSYDIPEKRRKARDQLRIQLRRLGCAMMQASVWLTPYNPIDTLRQFIADKGIDGTVLVSDLGRDASIGEETIENLIIRLYGLEAINARYKEWIDAYNSEQMSFESYIRYLAILKDDPQLPFALQPTWWKGDRAYRLIKPIISSLLFHPRA